MKKQKATDIQKLLKQTFRNSSFRDDHHPQDFLLSFAAWEPHSSTGKEELTNNQNQFYIMKSWGEKKPTHARELKASSYPILQCKMKT